MKTEIEILEKAVQEVRTVLTPSRSREGLGIVTDADDILLKAQLEIAHIKLMRQIAQEEIKKTFGDM